INNLSIQYADFGYWQQQWLQGEVLYQQVKYWRDKLSYDGKLVPNLQLLTDHPRPTIIQTLNNNNESSKSIKLSKSACKQIQSICYGGDVTIFMTLLAVFEILLYQYSGGQEHFAIGSPIANRNRIEIEGLIGFFVNTLVLKSDLAASSPS